MIRKWMMILLSLLLAVMLPFTAMADTQHTLRIVPGDMLASEKVVADLLDVVSLTLTTGSQSGALTVNLADSALATVGLTADSTGLYLQSNLLSDDVLYVTWDDGFAFLKDLLQSTLASQGVGTEEIEAVGAAMDEAKTSIVTAMQAGVTPSATFKNKEEIIAQALQMFGNDPEMIKFVTAIYSRMEVTEGTFTSEKHDAANQQITLTLTNEDLLAVCDTDYMHSLVQEIVRAQETYTTDEAVEEATEQLLAEMRKSFEENDMTVTTTVCQNADEELPVSMVVDTVMTVQEADSEQIIALKMDYNRLTGAEGVCHKATMTAGDGETAVIEMLFDLDRGFNAVSEGQFSILAGEEEITFLYHAENHEADTRARSLALYLRSGAAAIIPPAASDRPLITFEVTTSPADPALLSALENADASTSVNVMKLSAEEMEALVQSAGMRCMSVMYGALGKLPASVLTFAMSTLGE